MNFNVYVDKRTGERLARLARTRQTSRNALIREAVARLLERESGAGWPAEILDFQGMPGAPRFEASRRGLGSPRRDPLA